MGSDIECWLSLGSASELVGNQRLLFIFVNDDGNSPWTRQLRTPVVEKIDRALRWLEGEAQRRGVQLHFQHVCVPSKGPSRVTPSVTLMKMTIALGHTIRPGRMELWQDWPDQGQWPAVGMICSVCVDFR